jgi:hypothetical protein
LTTKGTADHGNTNKAAVMHRAHAETMPWDSSMVAVVKGNELVGLRKLDVNELQRAGGSRVAHAA